MENLAKHCRIANNIYDTDIFDENSPIMLDDKIDASPYIAYVWLCSKCNSWNLKIKANKNKEVFCQQCHERYDIGSFKLMQLGLINAITQNPGRVDINKFERDHGNPRGSIEAYPMLFYGWDCPSCSSHIDSIPRHDGKLFGCPKCGLRYRYNAIRYEDVDLVERYVNAGIKLFQI